MDMPMPKPPRKRDFNRGYTTLPPELLDPDFFPKLNARHMVILTFLASFGLDAWPKIDSLVKATGFSRSKVRRALYELTYIGVLTTRYRSDGRGRQTSNLYQLGDGNTDGGFSDSGRGRHIKACLAHDKLWTTLNQLFGSGKKGDADPVLVERFRWSDKTPAKASMDTTGEVMASPPEPVTVKDCVPVPPKPAVESSPERPCVFVSEVELDPAYAKTTPFGQMKTRAEGSSAFYKAFGRLHLADPDKVDQMMVFCRERKMQHASHEIIVRAHELGFTLFDLEREYEYAEANTNSEPQRLFLTRLRKEYRVNDKKDGFDPKDPVHAHAKAELETWLDQAGLEKQFKQARVNQLTSWMIAIVSVGHEPEDWLENFCDEFQISPELTPPGVICAKLRDHFDDFARNQWVKTEAGITVKLEDYLPGAEPQAREATPEDLTGHGEMTCPLANTEDNDQPATLPVSPPVPERSTGNKIDAVARLRELQAKSMAEIGKTPEEFVVETAAHEAKGKEGTAA